MSLEAFMVLVAAVAAGIITSVVLEKDVEEWVQTEDPACVLYVYNHNHLFARDSVDRIRYCKVD